MLNVIVCFCSCEQTSIKTQFYQDRNEELALLTSSIQKSIIMFEEHELEQIKVDMIIAESSTCKFSTAEIVDRNHLTKRWKKKKE
jgi:hypothetical protein